MFTCSVSVYSLFAVSFLRVFFCFIFPQYSTLVAPQTRFDFRCVVVVVYFYTKLVYFSNVSSLCSCVCALFTFSVFVLFIS